DYITGGSAGIVGIALAHGLAIATMVAATAAISGGHLNPAITIGLFTAGKIKLPNAVGYIVSQCVAAVVAILLLRICLPAEVLFDVNYGTPTVSDAPDITITMALVTEIILTFILMFVIYGSAVDKRAPKMGGLFIGLAVTLDILMGGPISGAAMNPARHLGPALLGGGLQNTWLYWLGPIIGAVLAAQVYKNLLEEKAS
ncbi:MAG: MIP/aquaporin family protein, partial [Candidatus Zixiibacteriota bacterium]